MPIEARHRIPTERMVVLKTKDEFLKVSRIRNAVESILKTNFYEKSSLRSTQREVRSQLSTDPFAVGPIVTSDTLKGDCGSISDDLGMSLKRNGTHTSFVNSSRFPDVREAIHYFLMVEGDIAVDPTIGQYINRHNHVFVGTIADLRALVLQADKDEQLTPLAQKYHHGDAEDFFERVWGSKQKIVW